MFYSLLNLLFSLLSVKNIGFTFSNHIDNLLTLLFIEPMFTIPSDILWTTFISCLLFLTWVSLFSHTLSWYSTCCPLSTALRRSCCVLFAETSLALSSFLQLIHTMIRNGWRFMTGCPSKHQSSIIDLGMCIIIDQRRTTQKHMIFDPDQGVLTAHLSRLYHMLRIL